jgi:hypothetical protein
VSIALHPVMADGVRTAERTHQDHLPERIGANIPESSGMHQTCQNCSIMRNDFDCAADYL